MSSSSPVFTAATGTSSSSGSTGTPSLEQLFDDALRHFAALTGLATPIMVRDWVTREAMSRITASTAPAPRVLEQKLIATVNAVLRGENAKMPKGDSRYPFDTHLTYWQVAQILLRLHHVITIAPNAKDTDREYDLLAMYRDTGRGRGTYTTSEDDIRTVARRYHTELKINDFKEVLAILREDAPRKHRCTHRDLIAVNNGIVSYRSNDTDIEIDGETFHFAAKDVHPFDPRLVYLSKSHVDYVIQNGKVIITHPDRPDWEVGAWLAELFDQEGQEGLEELVWEILGAIVRPHVSWGKTAWLYSMRGNNGKGTLCALMRNLVGDSAHTSIPLSDFGKEFALEPLVRVNAIIVDENDVGTLIDKAANMKAIVTGDVIQINRKFRMPIAFQFNGLMVQCLNEFPRAKDKSESFYRRQLFVPFTKSFTGAERKYIKDDYLKRPKVLEYVLWYVINHAGASAPGDYYEFSEPSATRVALDEYKGVNDPVRSFWEEFREEFAWDLLPFTFLYDLYKPWFASVSPSGSPVSRQQFINGLVEIVETDPLWGCSDKSLRIRTGLLMNDPEPLIARYELKPWYTPGYKGSDPVAQSQPMLSAQYRGIKRRDSAVTAVMLAANPPAASVPKDVDG